LASDKGDARAKAELGRVLFSLKQSNFNDSAALFKESRALGYEWANIYYGDIYAITYLKNRSKNDPWNTFYDSAISIYRQAVGSADNRVAQVARDRIAKLQEQHRAGPSSTSGGLLGLLLLGLGAAAILGSGGGGNSGSGATVPSTPQPAFNPQQFCMDVYDMTGTAAGCL
jgi:hypothetical protein